MINKQTAILFFIFLLLIMGIILVTIFKSPQINPQPKVSPELPQIGVDTSQSSINLQGITIKDQKTSLPTYLIKPPQNSEGQARKIATKLGFNGEETGKNKQSELSITQALGQTTYIWANSGKNRALVFDLGTSTFDFSSNLIEVAQPTDDKKAMETVNNFLKEFALFPEDFDSNIGFLNKDGSKGDRNSFAYYHLLLQPKAAGYPILSYRNNGEPIAFDLNKDFSFYKINYFYVPLQKLGQEVSLQLADSLVTPDTLKKTSPTFIHLVGGNTEEGLDGTVITNIDVNKIELVYYLDLLKTYKVFPSYKVTTTIKTSTNLSGTAIYLLPAGK